MTMLNRSVIDEVRIDKIALSDTTQPLLEIKYTVPMAAGEFPTSQPGRCSYAIDNNGGGGSLFRMTVTVANTDQTGTAAASTSYVYDGAASGSGTVTAVTATLGELVDELAQIPGIEVYRRNAPADYSLATNDFVDVTTADIGSIPQDILFKDASEIFTSAVRIGIPEPQDRGRIKLLGISGTCTGATAGTLKVYVDPSETSADDAEEALSFVLSTTEKEYLNGGDGYTVDSAPVFRGPLLVVATSNDLTAANIIVRTAQAEW